MKTLKIEPEVQQRIMANAENKNWQAIADLPPEAQKIVNDLKLHEYINHLAVDIIHRPGMDCHTLAHILKDRTLTKVFIRELRFCLGLEDKRPITPSS